MIKIYYATRHSVLSRKWKVVYKDQNNKIHEVERNISNEQRAKEIAEQYNREQLRSGR